MASKAPLEHLGTSRIEPGCIMIRLPDCPECKSVELLCRKTERAGSIVIRFYRCEDCGHVFKGIVTNPRHARTPSRTSPRNIHPKNNAQPIASQAGAGNTQTVTTPGRSAQS